MLSIIIITDTKRLDTIEYVLIMLKVINTKDANIHPNTSKGIFLNKSITIKTIPVINITAAHVKLVPIIKDNKLREAKYT